MNKILTFPKVLLRLYTEAINVSNRLFCNFLKRVCVFFSSYHSLYCSILSRANEMKKKRMHCFTLWNFQGQMAIISCLIYLSEVGNSLGNNFIRSKTKCNDHLVYAKARALILGSTANMQHWEFCNHTDYHINYNLLHWLRSLPF